MRGERASREPFSEFAGSLALLVSIVMVVVVALVLDSPRPKALRVALAGATYLTLLSVAAIGRRLKGAGPAMPQPWEFVLAGAAAGFVSEVVRAEATLPIVLVQTVSAGLLLGGFHWWTLRAWRRVYGHMVK